MNTSELLPAGLLASTAPSARLEGERIQARQVQQFAMRGGDRLKLYPGPVGAGQGWGKGLLVVILERGNS